MASVSVCDICGRPLTGDNARTFKLYLAPVVVGRTRSQHSDYTFHMDVGPCCRQRVRSLGKWQKRKSQPQKARVKAGANGGS